jgi:hypothetical protein
VSDKIMQKLAKQLMSLFTLTILLFGWGGWVILKNIFPNEQFSWYLYIPIMFFLMGNLLIIILAKNYKLEAKKLVNLYMVIKLVKLVTAMIYILAFYFIVKDDLRAFGLVFAAFYAIYIACEFYIFYSIEKQIKKEA